MRDDLGDRMKMYEGAYSDQRLMPLLPTIARMDGRSFHTFTSGMDRPYDKKLSNIMLETTLQLVRETNACVGYTQSDEITLAWHSTDHKSQIWFDGRRDKMVSQAAALATLYFYRLVLERMPEYAKKLPTFDARVWQVPNRAEGANVFLWRELDATKNSISMAAHAYYSDKELYGKNSSEKQEMLFQQGVNWNHYPSFFKRGGYVQKRKVSRPFSATELKKLPAKHKARTNPDLIVERTEWRVVNMPPIRTVGNREEVLFEGAEPIVSKP